MPSTPGFGEKLRAVFGLSPTILCLTGLGDGRVRDANDAFLSTSGYTREEILGRTPVELGLWVDPAQRDEGIRLLKAGQTVRGMECRFRVKSGEERVTVLSADVVMFDGEACILSALTDITDRTRAEAALRESERRFMVAFHANPLPMSITSLRDHRHLEVNEAAVRHSGYSREEMLGQTAPQLGSWVTTEQRERLLRLLHAEGRVRDLEVTFRTRAGEDRQLLVNSEVITFEGEPAVLSVSLDITERKLYEESLRAANRAKDEFLAMLGHELRNPLGTLTNAVAVLERLPDDETMRHVVAIIGRQTGHLGRLVDDLLDVARVTSGKIELQRGPVDLRALAGRCLDALAQAGRTGRHTVTLEGEPVYVDGDAARLEQVLNNLVDNALKYTPGAGRVTITTARAGETAVLRVRDTGQGDPHRPARARLRSLRAGAAEPRSLAGRPGARAGPREAAGGAAWRLGRGVECGARAGERVHGAAARGGGTGCRGGRAPSGHEAGRGPGPARAGRGGQRGRAPEPAPAARDGRARGGGVRGRAQRAGSAPRLPTGRGADRPGPARHGRLRGGARGARAAGDPRDPPRRGDRLRSGRGPAARARGGLRPARDEAGGRLDARRGAGPGYVVIAAAVTTGSSP
jgi:PAS domain S-box-containing protein